MSDQQQADALAYLAKRMSIKDVAYTVGVSEWAIVRLIGGR